MVFISCKLLSKTLRLKCGWSAVEAAYFNRTVDFNRVLLKCGLNCFSFRYFLGIFYQASFVSNGFFQRYFLIMLQIILWNCGWSAVETIDFNRTVDFNRKRLKCGWKHSSRVSTASTAFQPRQEISYVVPDQPLKKQLLDDMYTKTRQAITSTDALKNKKDNNIARKKQQQLVN